MSTTPPSVVETVATTSTAGRFLLLGPAGGPTATVEAPGWRLDDDVLCIDVQAEAGETWRASVSVVVDRDGAAPRHRRTRRSSL